MNEQSPQNNSDDKLPHTEEDFHATVKKKAERKLKTKREGIPKLWYGFGMSGIVGLLVMIPTLIGLYLGIWLDKNFPASYSYTLMGLFFGLLLGCFNAGYWIQKQRQE
jgi:ATP synthase protein I